MCMYGLFFGGYVVNSTGQAYRRLEHYGRRPDVQVAALNIGHSRRQRAKTPSHFTCLLTGARYASLETIIMRMKTLYCTLQRIYKF